jgi:hypothetical protein
MPAVQLFLSCVSDEFGGYRRPLSEDLALPDVAAKIQEQFKPQGGDTLSTLAEYLAPCAAIVHIVGDMTGDAPPASCVQALLARYPDLKTRLPPLAAAIDAGKTISYTQTRRCWSSCQRSAPSVDPDTHRQRSQERCRLSILLG